MKIMIGFEEELEKRVGEITWVDYNFENGMIPVENLKYMIQDLLYEYDVLKEKFEDLKEEEKSVNYDNPDYCERDYWETA